VRRASKINNGLGLKNEVTDISLAMVYKELIAIKEAAAEASCELLVASC